MNYSEAAYFDGNACQHVADRQERQRLERIAKAARAALRTVERRNGGRALRHSGGASATL